MQGFVSGFASDAPVRDENIPIVEKMSVTLHGEPGAFEIAEQSERTQLIGRATDADGEFQAQQFGRWLFQVTPLRLGRRRLFVTVSGIVSGKSGSASRALPDRTFEVRVQVSVKSMARATAGIAWAAVGLLFVSLVGAATQDLWYPRVKQTVVDLIDANAAIKPTKKL